MGYTGGKSQAGVHQWIINLIPPHRRYFEPFLGSGAILRLKKPAPVASIGIDIDPAAPGLALDLPHVPGLRLIRSNGTVMMQNFLDDSYFESADFVYCDPPYLPITRKNRRHYRCEMGEAGHLDLLGVLIALPCMVLVSGYPSPLYDRVLAGWHRETRRVMTRGHTWATECVWFNYPRPAVPHDTGSVGEDFRARWRLEKRRRRWRARLAKLPPAERAALVEVCAEFQRPPAPEMALAASNFPP